MIVRDVADSDYGGCTFHERIPRIVCTPVRKRSRKTAIAENTCMVQVLRPEDGMDFHRHGEKREADYGKHDEASKPPPAIAPNSLHYSTFFIVRTPRERRGTSKCRSEEPDSL